MIYLLLYYILLWYIGCIWKSIMSEDGLSAQDKTIIISHNNDLIYITLLFELTIITYMWID